MLRITAIDHIVIRVLDIERMLDFYISVLGGVLDKVQESIGLYHVRIGSFMIDLVPVDGKLGRMGGAPPGNEGRNVDHICFQVGGMDMDAILQFLEERQIYCEPPASRYGATGQGMSVYLKDPEGNVLELKPV